MAVWAARILGAAGIFLASLMPPTAGAQSPSPMAQPSPMARQQPARSVETTENADYFGFDLRTERNISLDQCGQICLGDSECRAFTYNTRARWCFLKSDYAKMNPFTGAVAGKVVNRGGEPDIGAPGALSFVPDNIADEARNYRQELLRGPEPTGEEGLFYLAATGTNAMQNGDPRSAVTSYKSAIRISPDDPQLWMALAKAAVAVEPANYQERAALQRDGTAAAWNAYQVTRGANMRAQSLSVLARALDKRELFRPALSAYEASLVLVNDPQVRADYADLKARKGFRVLDHSINNDTASPRVCLQLSEELVRSGVDYASFVTVNEKAPAAIDASDKQICVDGLEHGEHYRVALRAGLPAAIGEVLESPVVINVYVQDRPPSIRFTGDNFVLPSSARRGIPLVSVNTSMADLKLYRVGDRALAQLLSGYNFLRQLDQYELENIGNELGQPVWQGQIDISPELNKEVVTSFPVDEALPQRTPGVYVLSAVPQGDKSESWSSRATQWFLVSDIGLTTYTGQDGLHVFTRALSSAKPMAGVELTLLARNNEILGTATTDDQGRATFTAGLTRGDGGMVPAAITARGENDDYVFLDMTRAGFDLSDRGVTGRAAPGALDVYAWTERGIYRAGESVHGAALSRDDSADAVENLPLTFVFTRPDGVEDRRLVSDGRSMGGHAVDLALQSNAMRGTWQMRIYTDPKQSPVADVSFLVEDFVPDRIEFDITAPDEDIAVGENADIEIDGRFLYGAPAAGLEMEGEINLSTTREWEAFPGYQFGLADESNEDEAANQIELTDLPPLDEQGKASFPISIDAVPSTTQLVTADLTVRVREAGGRAVERSVDIGIAPETDLIGVRPQFDGSVAEGSIASFDVIAVDPAGERTDMAELRWTMLKLERNYQWYRTGNSWNYEPITRTTRVGEGSLALTSGDAAKISQPVGWGRYRLEIETADPTGPATSVEFDAGWYVSASSTETPDGLEIALDKDSYAPGETAKLQVSPRFAGELLIAIGSDRLVSTINATVPEGGATIDIPVKEEWGAGAYVTATLFRPGEAQESRMPMRAIGLKWMKIDPGARSLDVAIDTVLQTAPRQPLSIPISVEGAGSEPAYVMVAAVDVGILNLTRYMPPNPSDWYFGQRRMGLEIRDLYGRLIDGSLGATGRIRTGGDGGSMASEGSPPTEKLVAFFSGPVRLDAAGKAEISFDIPQFNGTARVMAVAWTKKAVGQAQKDVVIRDPVVIMAGMPRFLAPGDQADIRLDLANTDGPAGDYTLALEAGGKIELAADAPESINLGQGARTAVTVPVTASETGDASIRVTLTHASGLEVYQDLILPVRPPAMPMTDRRVVSLAAGGGSIRVDEELLADSLLDGASVAVGVSPSAAFDIPSLLMTLDRYPYGCTEQTTSRALPLLYVSELASASGLDPDPNLKQRIQDAIYRVLSNQSSSGSFGLWGPGYGDLWLDSYITDFLTRAREQDYDVPQEAMEQALTNLQNSLAYDQNIKDRGTEMAYATYVLARNKKASVGDLRYYADTQIDAFTSPMARAQIAASLALYGDVQRAEATFASALNLARNSSDNWNRSDYGSTLRDGAAILALAAETQPSPSVMPELIRYVAQRRAATRYMSTQDQAWMLLAARAIRSNGAAISLEVNGVTHSGNFARRVSGQELLGTPLTVVNRGTQPVEAVVTTVAAPSQPLPAGGNGFSIERNYYTLDGEEANVTEAAQNERFVVVIKVVENNAWDSRVVVTDLLPAGLQIDNPGLVASANLSNFDWLDEAGATHTEFRDDRFVAAFDRSSGSAREITMAYVVRAVTPGTYVHPAPVVEDMYRPQFNAHGAAGMMEVVAQ